MCIDRSCYDGDCERCRKIDRMCGWDDGYQMPKKDVVKTQEQQEKLNIIIEKQIKETEKIGRIFYRGKQNDSNKDRR